MLISVLNFTLILNSTPMALAETESNRVNRTWNQVRNLPSRLKSAIQPGPLAPTKAIAGFEGPKGQPVFYANSAPDSAGNRIVFSPDSRRSKNGFYGKLSAAGHLVWEDRLRAFRFDPSMPVSASVAAGAKNPIPSNHALKPYNPLEAAHRTRMAAQNAQSSSKATNSWSPSRLYQTLNWSAQKEALARRTVAKSIQGAGTNNQSPGLRSSFYSTANSSGLSDLTSPQMGASIAAFYALLGAVSAYEMITNYPNNPIALEKYLDNFNPVTMASMAGFIVVAMPFLNRMPGFSSMKDTFRSVPYYSAAMAAGLAGSIVVSMAADPDIQKCTGIRQLATSLKLERDLAACDVAFERYNNENMRRLLVPALTQIMTGATLFIGASYLVSVLGVAEKLANLNFVKSSSRAGVIGLGIGLVLNIGLAVGSQYVAITFLKAEKAGKELNEVGDLRRAEDNLIKGWELLKARTWVDLDPAEDISACPFNTITSIGLFVINPLATYFKGCMSGRKKLSVDQLDYNGILDRHAALQDHWRSIQMGEVQAAYQNWMRKVQKYHSLLGLSFVVYQEVLKRIAYEKANTTTDTDPNGLNAAAIIELKTSLLDDSTAELTADLNETWKYVQINDMVDFIVTSMACGPDVEGSGSVSIINRVQNVIGKNITGNSGPRQIVSSHSGYSIMFNPPRLIDAGRLNATSVCELKAHRPIYSIPILPSSMVKQTPEQFFVPSWSNPKNKDYSNLYDYIKDNLKDSIPTHDPVLFENWWKASLGPMVGQTEFDIREEYQKMLRTTYLKSLQQRDYKWCDEAAPNSTNGIAKQWLVLNQSHHSSAICGPTKLKRLAWGPLDSLRDQMMFYLSMLNDMGQGTGENLVAPHTAAILQSFDKMLQQTMQLNADSRLSVPELGMEIQNHFNSIQKILVGTVAEGQQLNPKQKIADNVLFRIGPLIERTNGLLNILTSFEVQSSPELEAVLSESNLDETLQEAGASSGKMQ